MPQQKERTQVVHRRRSVERSSLFIFSWTTTRVSALGLLLLLHSISFHRTESFGFRFEPIRRRENRCFGINKIAEASFAGFSRSLILSAEQQRDNTSMTTTTTTTTEEKSSSRKIVDQSTLTLLEHVNINVPSQEPYAVPFYFHVLGCGLDPRKASNLQPDATKKTLWANAGASQFHLPYGNVGQVIPGKIGLRYDTLEPLKRRLEQYADTGCVKESTVLKDETAGKETIQIEDYYGNRFWCREGGNPVSDTTLSQPIISSTDENDDKEKWGDEIVTKFGVIEGRAECRGIDFIEFMCPISTADKIAIFYESVFDATVTVVNDNRNKGNDGSANTRIAIIGFGQIDECGKPDQSLLFRETDETIPEYDGHHIAMYVGKTGKDFEVAFNNCKMANIVWVNPRFSDQVVDLNGARIEKQFRFKDILDLQTGTKIFELEHEIRSIEHEAWPGREL